MEANLLLALAAVVGFAFAREAGPVPAAIYVATVLVSAGSLRR